MSEYIDISLVIIGESTNDDSVQANYARGQ